jgi:hypothetical protein
MRVRSERGVALVTVLIITMLVSALLVGVTAMAMKQQQARFQDHDRTDTFYAAQAGVEKLTNDLGRLFAVNYAPSNAQIQALTTTPPSLSGGTTFVIPGGGTNSGYTITKLADTTGTVDSGPYAGLKGNITPYDVTVTAKSSTAAEVTLRRRVNAVAIPVFQFGIFSETDLSFFAGPTFNFGGKVHTNGNLFLLKGSGSELILADKVTAFGEVVRGHLPNGYPMTGGLNATGGAGSTYDGPVRVLTVKDGCSAALISATNCRAMGTDEGSVHDDMSRNTAWQPTTGTTNTGISLGTYAGWILNGAFGTVTGTAPNTTPVGTGAQKLVLPITTGGAKAIELIRRPAPGEDTAQPGLYDQRYYRLASVRILLSDNAADISNLPNTPGTPVDLTTIANISTSDPSAAAWTASNTTNPRLMDADQPLVTGFILVSMQNQAGDTWTDVTNEFLTPGISGRSLAPGGSTCDPGTGQIIRLQRVKDAGASSCTSKYNFWPNSLYDTREALVRDVIPTGANATQVKLGGVMYYTELDILNLRTWLASKRTTNSIMETTGYVVYFSDRRGNHNLANQPTGSETGEYGYEDINIVNGTPDAGEDVNESTTFDSYGGTPKVNMPTGLLGPYAAVTPSTWATPNQARSNRPLLFRRALKLVNGNRANMQTDASGNDPSGNPRQPLGLTVAAENPVYVQGDWNATLSEGTGTGGTFDLAHVGTAVIGDAVTLLSNAWTDLTSFSTTMGTCGSVTAATMYCPGLRGRSNTVYRLAIVSGKGMNFPRPAGTSEDFGTDGGTHNFLRFLEGNGQSIWYKGSIVSLFYNRQGSGTFKCCTTVYGPPAHNFTFDDDFTTMNLLPPRTPMFRTIDITSFSRLPEPPTTP